MTSSSAAASPTARLWVFNAGGEEALRLPAQQHYSPSREVRRLRYEATHLLRLLAEQGDYLYLPALEDSAARLLDHEGAELPRPPEAGTVLEVKPWVLEPHILKELTAAPCLAPYRLLLPELDAPYCRLAHRRGCAGLVERCCRELGYPEALGAHWVEAGADRAETERRLLELWRRLGAEQAAGARLVLKRPYSSSGRGVQLVSALPAARELSSAVGSCQRLGSVSLEPYWQVEANWALEYERLETGAVHFVGYSHFVTSERGAYAGNVLWTQQQLGEQLRALVPERELAALIALHEAYLSEQLAGSSYVGYIGIDLFVYRRGEALALHPAVEINLRCTMGVLAHRAQLRDWPEGSRELFTLDYGQGVRR